MTEDQEPIDYAKLQRDIAATRDTRTCDSCEVISYHELHKRCADCKAHNETTRPWDFVADIEPEVFREFVDSRTTAWPFDELRELPRRKGGFEFL